MTAQEIVEPLLNKGFSLWVEGGSLRYKPTPDIQTVANLRQHKAEIVSFLTGRKCQNSQERTNSEQETPLSRGQKSFDELSRQEPQGEVKGTEPSKTPSSLPIVQPASPNAELPAITQDEWNAVLCPLYKAVDSGRIPEKTVIELLDCLQDPENVKNPEIMRELFNLAKGFKK